MSEIAKKLFFGDFVEKVKIAVFGSGSAAELSFSGDVAYVLGCNPLKNLSKICIGSGEN